MISKMLRRVLDVLSPRSCAMCGQRLPMATETLCINCNRALPRTDYVSEPYENELARHFWGKFKVEKAAAWFFYHPSTPSAEMIVDFKYRHQPLLAQELGYIAATEFNNYGFFEGIDMIVPVPLTKRRRRERGYNQTLEIAQGVSRMTGIEIADDVLRRTKFTVSQTHKNIHEKAQNVKGAFSLINPKKVAGRHVLLIDDVVTSGATLSECGIELAKAGNVSISIMTLGYTKS